jgi:hypothetical protein
MGKVSVEQRIQSVLENIMSRKIPIYLSVSKGQHQCHF